MVGGRGSVVDSSMLATGVSLVCQSGSQATLRRGPGGGGGGGTAGGAAPRHSTQHAEGGHSTRLSPGLCAAWLTSAP